MALERTFSIIKPDATKRNLTGKVNAVIEDAGLRIVAQRRIQMSQAQAEKFYEVHKERPFFGELVEFMTSAPVVVQNLVFPLVAMVISRMVAVYGDARRIR